MSPIFLIMIKWKVLFLPGSFLPSLLARNYFYKIIQFKLFDILCWRDVYKILLFIYVSCSARTLKECIGICVSICLYYTVEVVHLGSRVRIGYKIWTKRKICQNGSKNETCIINFNIIVFALTHFIIFLLN